VLSENSRNADNFNTRIIFIFCKRYKKYAYPTRSKFEKGWCRSREKASKSPISGVWTRFGSMIHSKGCYRWQIACNGFDIQDTWVLSNNAKTYTELSVQHTWQKSTFYISDILKITVFSLPQNGSINQKLITQACPFVHAVFCSRPSKLQRNPKMAALTTSSPVIMSEGFFS